MNPKLGNYTSVKLGDVGSISMHSHGCEDAGCDCGGADLAVILSQVDGTGAMVTLPLRSWAFVAATVNKAILDKHPEMVLAALRTIESNTHRPEPTPEPEVPSQWVDAIPYLQEAIPPATPPPDVVEMALRQYSEMLVGSWAQLMGKGKVHQIGSISAALDGTTILIKTLCGREAVGWKAPDIQSVPESDVCATCLKKASPQ